MVDCGRLWVGEEGEEGEEEEEGGWILIGFGKGVGV